MGNFSLTGPVAMLETKENVSGVNGLVHQYSRRFFGLTLY